MLLVALMASRCGDPTPDTGPTDSTAEEIHWCPERDVPDLEDRWSHADIAPGGDLFHVVAAGDVVYAASTMNGLYRSDDGGTSWSKKRTDVTHLQAQVAVDPEDPDVVAYATNQLVWSLDGGETSTGAGWPDLSSSVVRGLLHTDGHFLALLDRGEVYIVAPGQEPDWIGTIDHPPPPPHGFGSSMFEPDETWWFLAEADGALLAAHQGGGVYRSTDGGVSWSNVVEGDVQITTLGADGERAWFAAEEHLFTSEDAGKIWLSFELGFDARGAIWTGEGWVVAGTEDLFTFEDGEPISSGELPGVHDLRFVTRLDDDTLLAVHRDGAYRSTDHGQSWSTANGGLEVTDLGPLLAHPTCPSVMWVGTQCERGLYESLDGWGEGLRYVDEYLHYVMVARARGTELWITTDNTLKRSPDLGATWETVAPEVIDVHVHGLALHPTDEDVVLVGSVGSGPVDDGDEVARILRTADGGVTWTAASGVPDSDTSIHALHFVDDDIALAGTYAGGDYVHQNGQPGIGILRSTDSGVSWALDGDGPRTVPVFDQCGDRVFAASDEGLLFSDDAGLSWSTGHESGRAYLSVACREDLVLALDTQELWRSDDAGETWVSWSEGLSSELWAPRQMPQVDINADGTMGYTAIPGEGLLRRPL
ncbi:MAG: hypothetical protein GY913_11295 [Proteobacteria bacterium]|nr:hypothetical protein [Pseudomonadota bacterium]MCP4917499.1 hypothetical protein [Pseudomonadota bacterium]